LPTVNPELAQKLSPQTTADYMALLPLPSAPFVVASW